MKKILLILTLFIALAAPLRAQVFMMDGEGNYREPEDPEVFAGLPENYGLGVDWYTPVGDGLLLLSAMGGVFILAKKRRDSKQKKNK